MKYIFEFLSIPFTIIIWLISAACVAIINKEELQKLSKKEAERKMVRDMEFFFLYEGYFAVPAWIRGIISLAVYYLWFL